LRGTGGGGGSAEGGWRTGIALYGKPAIIRTCGAAVFSMHASHARFADSDLTNDAVDWSESMLITAAFVFVIGLMTSPCRDASMMITAGVTAAPSVGTASVGTIKDSQLKGGGRNDPRHIWLVAVKRSAKTSTCDVWFALEPKWLRILGVVWRDIFVLEINNQK
jgi:hypothetical protein